MLQEPEIPEGSTDMQPSCAQQPFYYLKELFYDQEVGSG